MSGPTSEVDFVVVMVVALRYVSIGEHEPIESVTHFIRFQDFDILAQRHACCSDDLPDTTLA